MRHRKKGRKLGRKTEHRIALKRNLLKSLFEHGRITTTLAKAKEYRPHAEKVITLARERSLHRIRRASQILGNDREVVKKLFDEIGPAFQDRPGGYTRILKLNKPRLGDAAPRAILELVGESERRAREAEDAAELASQSKTKKKARKKKAAAKESE
jgi:large subunit ribosomal protein L17